MTSHSPSNSNKPYLSIEEFNYHLPQERIAQHPMHPRDHSRMLVIDRASEQLTHKQFFNCVDYLNPGDLLIVNNSKVINARLQATKTTGGKVEIFLLHQFEDRIWECMIGGRNMKPGTVLTVHNPQGNDFVGTLSEKVTNRTWKITFNQSGVTSVGEIPLPPYITERSDPDQLQTEYQTVYADPEGSVAAPTAGLHFTDTVLTQLKHKGVTIETVTLHVGLGTFAPVKTDNVYEHDMHSEFGILPESTAAAIATTKANGGRVITVGTTATRTLEAFHGKANSDWIDLFITPGYTFNTVDAMFTNFHLPKSTLLMLVAAFTGKELMDTAYRTAIEEEYRFYSFGDSMFII